MAAAAQKIICLQSKLVEHQRQIIGAFWPRAAAAFPHLTAERLGRGVKLWLVELTPLFLAISAGLVSTPALLVLNIKQCSFITLSALALLLSLHLRVC
jgi:hypothetical protein